MTAEEGYLSTLVGFTTWESTPLVMSTVISDSSSSGESISPCTSVILMKALALYDSSPLFQTFFYFFRSKRSSLIALFLLSSIMEIGITLLKLVTIIVAAADLKLRIVLG